MSFTSLIEDTGEMAHRTKKESKVVGIRSRKNFRRFTFLVKSSMHYSSPKGHLTSVFYPKITPNNIRGRKFKGRPLTADVLVWCTCPAFLYWGSRYWSTQEKYKIKDKPRENRKPDIRDPNRSNLLCKHCLRVGQTLKGYSFRRLVSVFDRSISSSVASESGNVLEFANWDIVIPAATDYLRLNNYTQADIDEFKFALTEDTYEDVLKQYGVII